MPVTMKLQDNIIEFLGLRKNVVALLTAVEMVTAMLIYIPVAYLADRTTKKPFVVGTFHFLSRGRDLR